LFILSIIYQLVDSATYNIIAGSIAGSCPNQKTKAEIISNNPGAPGPSIYSVTDASSTDGDLLLTHF
jgi:hypothetical protein